MSAVPEQVLGTTNVSDVDPQEAKEWLEAPQGAIDAEGPRRAAFLLDKQIEYAHINGVTSSLHAETLYINTIPVENQDRVPGNQEIEHCTRSYVCWNAMTMVPRANKDTNAGGHISSFASAATLYNVGYNYLQHASSGKRGGDMAFVRGHSVPGVYSRVFLLGRLTEEQLDNFRQEVDGKGISSYPYPWLVPDLWQFPTVPMGLGPIMAIYQVRSTKYLASRGLIQNQENCKVWAFPGDGETNEPEPPDTIGTAGCEKLNNLAFVISCNPQRLDGPVRGNGKIIQELELEFRGAGWNVIKVIWGSRWDQLLARGTKGLLMSRVMECVDGEYQTFKSKSGAHAREHFFNTSEPKVMVADWSDDGIWVPNRGGHNPHKICAVFQSATNHKGQPTVILAKIIKGCGMGETSEAMNIAHQQKGMPVDVIHKLRDRFNIPVVDDRLEHVLYAKFGKGSKELECMRKARMDLGGYLPARHQKADALQIPALSVFDALLKAIGEGREVSTTMAFVRILDILLKDKNIGKHVVLIMPDKLHTFDMEGLFRQAGIWNQEDQRYVPQGYDQLMFYEESQTGQMLQEGINEVGAMCDWIAAATLCSTYGVVMIPFYIHYSMFGIQRIGDLCWAVGDMRSRGFLLSGTAGCTTLNGEGLQHEDGHSYVYHAVIPNCISYGPTFQYELVVVAQDGLRRMYVEQEDAYYYLMVMNENYEYPEMPVGVEADTTKGIHQFRKGVENSNAPYVQLLGSGTISREVITAADLPKKDWGVESDLWGCPSFTELVREGNATARWNLLNPAEPQRESHVEKLLKNACGPVIASTDYVRTFTEQARVFVPRRYAALGIDGFGRSDTREKPRHFFRADRYWVTVVLLRALADEGVLPREKVAKVLKKYNLDSNKPNPMTV